MSRDPGPLGPGPLGCGSVLSVGPGEPAFLPDVGINLSLRGQGRHALPPLLWLFVEQGGRALRYQGLATRRVPCLWFAIRVPRYIVQ